MEKKAFIKVETFDGGVHIQTMEGFTFKTVVLIIKRY